MIDVIIVAVIGLVAGAVLTVWVMSKAIKSVIQRANLSRDEELQILSKHVSSNFIFMNVEQHDEGMFAYNALNGEFVCHGTDEAQLRQRFMERFPTKKGVIVNPDLGHAHELA